jgi:HK97 family phage portal protein
MNVILSVKRWLGLGATTKGLDPVRAFLTGETPVSGRLTLGNAYEASVWVYACVARLAESLANVPWVICRGEAEDRGQRAEGRGRRGMGRRSEGEVVDAGAVVELFAQPNSLMTGFDFWEMLVTWLMLRGKAYVIGRTRAGQVVNWSLEGRAGQVPAELLILPVDQVRLVRASGVVLGYQYMAGADSPVESLMLVPEEVIALRMPWYQDWYEGMAPVAVAQLAAQTDYASANFMRGVMENNADTGLVVRTDQQLSDEQRVQLTAALRARKKRGTIDAPLILTGGLQVEKPTVSNVDLQFLENRKFSRQEICAVFAVPQEILGFTEDANRSVSEVQRLNFYENRVLPLGARIGAVMQRVVRAFGRDLEGWFNPEQLPVFQASRRMRIDAGVKLFGLGVPLNDINESLDLGLPEYAWGEVGYLPFGLTEAGGEPAAGPMAEDGGDESNGKDGKESGNGKDETGNLKEDGDGKSGNKTTEARRGTEGPPSLKLWRAGGQENLGHENGRCTCGMGEEHDAGVTARVKLMRSRVRRFFWEQRGRVLERLETAARNLNDETGNVKGKAFEEVFDFGAENELLLASIKPLVVADMVYGGAKLWAELSMQADFKLRPEAALRYLRARANMVSGINQTTFDAIRKELLAGVEAGEGYEKLADRVKGVFSQASDIRAERIATTEVNTALNAGRHEGMTEAGVEKRIWRMSNLDGVRPTHQMAARDFAEGLEVNLPFMVGGFRMMYPGDTSLGAPASETVNCRCYTVAVVGKT